MSVQLKTLLVLSLFLFLAASPALAEELTLAGAIEMALESNHLVRAAAYDTSAADWGFRRSFSSWLPRVYFNTTWSRPDPDTLDAADEAYETMRLFDTSAERTLYENNYSSSLSVIQPLFNGGVEYFAIRAASISRDRARLTEEDARLQIILQVKKIYFGALKSKALLRVAEESLLLARESLKMMRARLEVGQVTRSEVLRWEAEVATAEGARVEAENAYAQTMMQLANILGRSINEEFELPALPEDVEPADLLRAEQATSAGVDVPLQVSRHPSVRAMAGNVELAEVENRQTWGTLLPNVNFSYTYNWQTNDTMMPDEDTSWTMGIGVEIPLFQGLSAVTGIGQTRRQVESVRLQVEDYRRNFVQQAYAARLNLRTARLRVLSARKARRHSAANLEIVQSRNQLGMVTQLELLDAQLAYKRAQSQLIAAVSDFYIALADWEYVVASLQGESED